MQIDKRIIELCNKRFDELGTYKLVLPFANITALEQLKRLPRTGKAVRLCKLGIPDIKVRTVFDHTASLPYSAAALLPLEKGIDVEVLSCLIVYHDINEILIGDFPKFTKEMPRSESRRRVECVGKDIRERAANNFLWLFGDENHRKAFYILSLTSREKEFLKILDLIDPIIAVWRYSRVYNNLLKNKAELFLETLSDFFIYPALLEFLRLCPYKPLELVLKILCNKKAALYYLTSLDFTALTNDGEVRTLLSYLIEETPLFFN